MAGRKPDEQLAYILARVEDVKERDGARNRRWDDVEAIRYRQHPLPIPKRYQEVGLEPIRTSRVNQDIRVVVGIVTESFPVVEVPQRDESRTAQEQSSLIEKSLNAILRRLDSGGGPQRPYKRAVDAAATFGQGVHKLLYLTDAWDADEFEQDAEETAAEYLERIEHYKQDARLPFVWLAVDPRCFHGVYRLGQLTEVLEISKRRRYELAESYKAQGVRLDPTTGRLVNRRLRLDPSRADSALGAMPGESIDFVEHWELVERPKDKGKKRKDKDERQSRYSAVVTYLADGILLAQIDTGYPRLPYFPFFNMQTGSSAPEYECQGVADDMIAYVPSADAALTMRQAWAIIAAYAMGYNRKALPPGGVQGVPGLVGGGALAQAGAAVESAIQTGEAPVSQVVKWEPLTFTTLQAGEEMGWTQPPPVGKDLAVQPEMLLDLIDKASPVPDILRGKSDSGTPASLGAQNLAAASRNLDPLTDNQAEALANMTRFLLWLIEHKHGDAIYIDSTEKGQGRTRVNKKLRLRPEDINGYHSLSINITTLSQDRMIQLGQFLAQMQAQGAIPMQELRQRGLQYPAPEELDLQVLFERYVNSPQADERIWQMVDQMLGKIAPPPPQMPGGQPGLPLDPAAMAQQGGAMPPGMPPEGMAAQQQAMAEAPSSVQQIAGTPAITSPTPGLGLPLVSPAMTPQPAM